MHSIHRFPACALAVALVWAALSGCTRSARASFVPVLDVGLRLNRSAASAQTNARSGQTFATECYVWLSFRPQSPAASLPLPSDAGGLLLQAPCADDDTVCLDEAAESEPELQKLQEDVP